MKRSSSRSNQRENNWISSGESLDELADHVFSRNYSAASVSSSAAGESAGNTENKVVTEAYNGEDSRIVDHGYLRQLDLKSEYMIDPDSFRMPSEVERGNVEYKRRIDPTPERFQELTSQLKWRLSSNGEAWYEIGVADNGIVLGLEYKELSTSLQVLERMCQAADAKIVKIQRQKVIKLPSDHPLFNMYYMKPGMASAGETKGAVTKQHWAAMTRSGSTISSSSTSTKSQFLVMAEVQIRQNRKPHSFTETKVAVLGDTRTGKSTLLGYLSHGVLDDGRGKARIHLLRHRHEIISGRTSSISSTVIGFDAEGNILTLDQSGHSSDKQPNLGGYVSVLKSQDVWPIFDSNDESWTRLLSGASKIVSLFDMAGHEKYLKTTISGLVRYSPDYSCLIISSLSDGISEITKEVDICTTDQFGRITTAIASFLQTQGKELVLLSSIDDLEVAMNLMVNPNGKIFAMTVSSVTATGFDILKQFLFRLPKQQMPYNTISDTALVPPLANSTSLSVGDQSKGPIEFHVEEVYQVLDVGTVLSGTLHSGIIKIDDKIPLFLGPDKRGNYRRVRCKSIHRQRTPVDQIEAGQSATLALYDVDRKFVRSGMVLFGDKSLSTHQSRIHGSSSSIMSRQSSFNSIDKIGIGFSAFYELEAMVTVICAQKPIYPKQTGLLHVGCAKQTVILKQICQIVNSPNGDIKDGDLGDLSSTPGSEMNNNLEAITTPCLRENDEAVVRFRFVTRPEYIRKGSKLVYNNGKTKMVGHVHRVIDEHLKK